MHPTGVPLRVQPGLYAPLIMCMFCHVLAFPFFPRQGLLNIHHLHHHHHHCRCCVCFVTVHLCGLTFCCFVQSPKLGLSDLAVGLTRFTCAVSATDLCLLVGGEVSHKLALALFTPQRHSLSIHESASECEHMSLNLHELLCMPR